MNNVIHTGKVSMINLRGSLRMVNAMVVDELKAQGWKVVINPRRDYYPEYDQSNKNNMAGSGEVDDMADSANILRFEDV